MKPKTKKRIAILSASVGYGIFLYAVISGRLSHKSPNPLPLWVFWIAVLTGVGGLAAIGEIQDPDAKPRVRSPEAQARLDKAAKIFGPVFAVILAPLIVVVKVLDRVVPFIIASIIAYVLAKITSR